MWRILVTKLYVIADIRIECKFGFSIAFIRSLRLFDCNRRTKFTLPRCVILPSMYTLFNVTMKASAFSRITFTLAVHLIVAVKNTSHCEVPDVITSNCLQRRLTTKLWNMQQFSFVKKLHVYFRVLISIFILYFYCVPSLHFIVQNRSKQRKNRRIK